MATRMAMVPQAGSRADASLRACARGVSRRLRILARRPALHPDDRVPESIAGRDGRHHQRCLRDGMESLGIRHHLTLDGSASSYAPVFVDPDGNRAIYMMRGATAELKASEIRARHGAFIKNARIVTTEISQLPLKTVIAILKFARENSIPTILDLDVPPSDAISTLGTRTEL